MIIFWVPCDLCWLLIDFWVEFRVLVWIYDILTSLISPLRNYFFSLCCTNEAEICADPHYIFWALIKKGACQWKIMVCEGLCLQNLPIFSEKRRPLRKPDFKVPMQSLPFWEWSSEIICFLSNTVALQFCVLERLTFLYSNLWFQ